MTDKKLEERIQVAMEHAVPDVWDNILASCKNEKRNVIDMTSKNNQRNGNHKLNKKYINRRNTWKKYVAAASLLFVLGAGGLGVSAYQENAKVNSTIMFDVNPSISIEVNKKDRVLSVVPTNEDGIKILGNMDLKRTDIDVAVNAIVGSMLQQGYITDEENAILISVKNDNEEKGLTLQKRISTAVENALNSNSLDSAVYSQLINDSTNLDLSNQYKISLGKATLISEILKKDSTLTFEKLAELEIHEIALLMETRKIEDNKITHTGKVSDKKYITREQVETIVYDHSKVSKSVVKDVEIELDVEEGIMVYEVEFKADKLEYDYNVNAITGEIVSFETDYDDDYKQGENTNQNKNQNQAIGKEKAESIAIAHANVKAESIKKISTKYDKEDNEYEVEFLTSTTEYEYDIHAFTGKILDFDIEKIDNSKSSSNRQSDDGQGQDNDRNDDDQGEDDDRNDDDQGQDNDDNSKKKASTSNTVYIPKEKVKSITLTHAKISESKVRNYSVSLDKEGGVMVYEVEFETSDMEYDYTVNAVTGKIIEVETEKNNSTTTAQSNQER